MNFDRVRLATVLAVSAVVATGCGRRDCYDAYGNPQSCGSGAHGYYGGGRAGGGGGGDDAGGVARGGFGGTGEGGGFGGGGE
jgi:hypothetical protein